MNLSFHNITEKEFYNKVALFIEVLSFHYS